MILYDNLLMLNLEGLPVVSERERERMIKSIDRKNYPKLSIIEINSLNLIDTLKRNEHNTIRK